MNNTDRPRISGGGRYRLVDRIEALNAGVPANAMRVPSGLYEPQLMRDEQIWVRAQLNDKWIAAYRIVSQDGYPVVGELRVFPSESGSSPSSGTWRSGEFLGPRAPVPAGGLSARIVHSIRVGEHISHMGTLLEKLRRIEWPDGVKPIRPEDYSLTGTRPPRSPHRRGRKGHPDLFLAQLARDYVAACAKNSRRPTADLAKRRGLDRDRVRDLLSKARKRGLLTRLKHGAGGGQITEKAQAILDTAVPRNVPTATKEGRRRGSAGT